MICDMLNLLVIATACISDDVVNLMFEKEGRKNLKGQTDLNSVKNKFFLGTVDGIVQLFHEKQHIIKSKRKPYYTIGNSSFILIWVP